MPPDIARERALLRDRFARSPRMARLEITAIHDTGVTLLPTGRSPHYDLVLLTVDGEPRGDAAAIIHLVDRLVTVRHTVIVNPFHSPSGGLA